jgi:hypothetical protein
MFDISIKRTPDNPMSTANITPNTIIREKKMRALLAW